MDTIIANALGIVAIIGIVVAYFDAFTDFF